jgi:hypothetical protein
MTYTAGLGVATLGRGLVGVEGISTEVGTFALDAEAQLVMAGIVVEIGNFSPILAEATLTFEPEERLWAMVAEANIDFAGLAVEFGNFSMTANATLNWFWVPYLCQGNARVNCVSENAKVNRVPIPATVGSNAGSGNVGSVPPPDDVTFGEIPGQNC